MLRATRVRIGSHHDFVYGTFTLSGSTFQYNSTIDQIFYSTMIRPTTPGTPKGSRFGLIPVRSPLLGESWLLSLPEVTEMFQFASFASQSLYIQLRDIQVLACMGCPIRKSPDHRIFAPTRGLSQLITSFIACLCQGIHRAPFLA